MKTRGRNFFCGESCYSDGKYFPVLEVPASLRSLPTREADPRHRYFSMVLISLSRDVILSSV
jgi:hypothetical protein